MHGWLYVVYLAIDFALWRYGRWSFTRFLFIALGGIVPLLSFVFERIVPRYVEDRSRLHRAESHAVTGEVPRPVLVVDFGAQYAQLIARRVREANVYSEIVPHTVTAAEVSAKNPVGIVLSGGPSSVYQAGAPSLDPGILELGVPTLGICYGFQVIAQQFDGRLPRLASEYGATR